MGRSPCCDKLGLKKGPWTPEEDQKLLAYIEEHGHGNWRALPTKAGLQRCGKSCRLRWTNYLRPDIKRGKFSLQEEQTIIQLHALLGNRWSAIATHLPKRTDNEIKNYWNTHLKKRLAKMGIDPVTHKPKNDALLPAADGDGKVTKNAANLSHIAQWESARLEAEARLARQSKVRGNSNSNNVNINSSTFASSAISPDVHINDHHHQIVPPLGLLSSSSSSSSSVAAAHHHHHQYLSVTTNASVSVSVSVSAATTTTNTLKAWHSVWPNATTSTYDNEPIICFGMGSNGIGGGGVGVGIESPTSTLSFLENAPPVIPGAVIEFMGHHNDHQQEQMVKKEGDHHNHQQLQQHKWKRGGAFDNGIEIEIQMNSLPFSPASAEFHDMNAISIHQSKETHGGNEKDDDDQDDLDEDPDPDHGQGFIEGFTELLLSTNTTTDTTIKTTSCGEKSRAKDGHVDEDNNDNSSAGTTSRSGGSDYYEDNKTYWNSILNLVNSSPPPHSPMF
ncbi:hypothetical protein SOVF_187060 [Spinacia oleracea]|uniref:Transcription factor MYB106 n=1 Tax=Spinacia oleracea TaxID=3562 RepID=A0A9R0K3A9_SPIOL|nr:transcription factor MYB106-like [Spinacia oleracea]KNA05795.1 hypothetical protein SOVF_187060 [Spinacia oleracea]